MDQLVGLGQSPQDPVAQLTTAMQTLQDSIAGPANGVKTALDSISGLYNSTATPPPAGSQAAMAALLSASTDTTIGPAITPTLTALGTALTNVDGQAATAATNFTNAYTAANTLATDYGALQTSNQQLAQALQTLYAAAGYTDYTTPIGTVAAAVGAQQAKIAALQQQITQLQQKPAPPAPAPVPIAPVVVAPVATPLLNPTTIIAGIAALAVIGGGIWWYTSAQKKKKLGMLPTSRRPTMPSAAPMMGEQQPASAQRPARRSFPMSSRPNATARALMPRSVQARGGHHA